MKTTANLLLAVAAAVALCGSAPAADEWPRFRGPNGSGTADGAGIPAQWTEKDYNWRVELPGGGHSSPVVWGDRIFLTAGMPDTGKRIVLCLKTSDGNTVWKKEYESPTSSMNGLNSYGTVTPAVDKDFVFVSWATPEKYMVVALDHDGGEVWQRDLGPFASQHGHGASQIVWEDLVIVPNDQDKVSFLAALDRKTGRTRWQTPRTSGRAAYSTPCVFRPMSASPELIFTSTSHGVTAVDPKTGKVNWELPDIFPASKRVVASPVAVGGIVLAQCGEGGAGVHVVAVRPPAKESEKPEVVWKVTKNAPYVPMPVVRGDLVFLFSDSGTASCVRLTTGEAVWSEKLGGTIYGSPVLAGDRLYCINLKGEVLVLRAADKYELLARNPLGEKSQATPAVAGGRMYLRTWSHLMSIGK